MNKSSSKTWTMNWAAWVGGWTNKAGLGDGLKNRKSYLCLEMTILFIIGINGYISINWGSLRVIGLLNKWVVL